MSNTQQKSDNDGDLLGTVALWLIGVLMSVTLLVGRQYTAVVGWLLLLVVTALSPDPTRWFSATVLALASVITGYAWKRWTWLGLLTPIVSERIRGAWRAGVALPDFHADRQERAIISALRRQWRPLMDRWRLTVVVGRTLRGEDKTAWPILQDWNRVPLGLSGTIRPVNGQDPSAIVAHADEMASALGWPVRATILGPQTVEIIIVMRDPLTGIRETAAPTGILTPLVIGRREDGGDAVIDLRDASHIAIQGMTRSGKSVMTYGLLSQLVGTPEVRVMGTDPNAVLLAPWVAQSQPGDIALGSDADQALAVIDRAVTLMDERLHDLPTQRLEKIEHFSAETPIILLVLEEYPALMRAAELADAGRKPAERVLPRIRAQVGRLVSEGAKAGIRVLMITQRADASILDGPTRAQMGTRLTFAVDNRDAVTMLHPAAEPDVVDAVRAFPAGRALMWQHRQEHVVQADFTPYDEYLTRIEGTTTNADAA